MSSTHVGETIAQWIQYYMSVSRCHLPPEDCSGLQEQGGICICHLDPGIVRYPCSCFGLIKLASPQNEPLNSNPTYPTCTMTAAIEAQIGKALRSQLNSNGLSSTKLIGWYTYAIYGMLR